MCRITVTHSALICQQLVESQALPGLRPAGEKGLAVQLEQLLRHRLGDGVVHHGRIERKEAERRPKEDEIHRALFADLNSDVRRVEGMNLRRVFFDGLVDVLGVVSLPMDTPIVPMERVL